MSNLDSFEVKKFAVKYEPPTLVIEYKNKATQKTYLKKMRLKNIASSTAIRLTDKIISQNLDLLGPEKVSRDQVYDLITRIYDNTPQESSKELSKESTESNLSTQSKTNEYGDLNKASDVIIEKAKSEMNVDFEANRIQPGDKNFQWDKKVEFEAPVGASDWDDEEEEY